MHRWTIRKNGFVVKAGDADRTWQAWDDACIALITGVGCSWSDLDDETLEVINQIHHTPVSVKVLDYLITTAAA